AVGGPERGQPRPGGAVAHPHADVGVAALVAGSGAGDGPEGQAAARSGGLAARGTWEPSLHERLERPRRPRRRDHLDRAVVEDDLVLRYRLRDVAGGEDAVGRAARRGSEGV